LIDEHCSLRSDKIATMKNYTEITIDSIKTTVGAIEKFRGQTQHANEKSVIDRIQKLGERLLLAAGCWTGKSDEIGIDHSTGEHIEIDDPNLKIFREAKEIGARIARTRRLLEPQESILVKKTLLERETPAAAFFNGRNVIVADREPWFSALESVRQDYAYEMGLKAIVEFEKKK